MAKALGNCATRAERVELIADAIARQRARLHPLLPVKAGDWLRRGVPSALTASAGPAVSKGRISNRTLPKPATVPAQDEQQRLRHAVHEAAHATIAVLCGAGVASVEVHPVGVKRPDGSMEHGRCVMAPLSTVVAPQEALITAAGAVAEAVVLHGPRPTGAQIDALLSRTGDGVSLRRLAMAQESDGAPTSEALRLVLRCWPAICQLAVRIDSGRETRHRHVLDALGIPYNDEAPFALASIRAGVRTVPVPRRSRT